MGFCLLLVALAGCSAPATVPTPVPAPGRTAAPPGTAAPVLTPALAPTPTPALAQAPTPALAQAPTRAPVAASPLKHRDVPPGAFQSTITFGGYGPGAGDTCDFAPSADRQPQPGIAECIAEINQPMTLSFLGFAPRQPVAFEARGPGGVIQQTATATTKPNGVAEWDWRALPVDALGSYTLQARQGSLTSSATAEVRPASAPSRVVVPHSGPAGTTFHLYLAGLQPGAAIQLALYRSRKSDDFLFAASLGSIVADDRGIASYDLATSPDDPWNDYVISSDPEIGRTTSGFFSIQAPDPLPTSPGVPARLPDAGTDASQTCGARVVRAGAQDADLGAVELGQAISICLQGFTPGQSILTDTRGPDGNATLSFTATNADAQGAAAISPRYGVDMAPGVHTLSIKGSYSGLVQATARLLVRSPAQPRVVVQTDSTGNDRQLEFQLIDFAADTSVRVHLYRRTAASEWSYAGSLPATAITTERTNVRRYVFDDQAPVGEYRLVTEPPIATGSLDRYTLPEPRVSAPRRTEAVPSGVPASLPIAASQPECLPQTASPDRVVDLGGFEIAQVVPSACVVGLPPNTDLDLVTQGPTPKVRSIQAVHTDARGAARALVMGVPEEPPGRYTLNLVLDGQSTPLAQYTLRAASAPRLGFPVQQHTAGDEVYGVLAGFAPNQVLELYVYGRSEQCGCMAYRAALPPVHADGSGATNVRIPTDAGDPTGRYSVAVQPGNVRSEFDLAAVPLRSAADLHADLVKFASTTLTDANKGWAAAVARGGDLDTLKNVFGGAWLEEVQTSAFKMRAAGQFRVARLAAPLVIRSATQTNNRHIEADTVEEWDDALYAADGSLVQRLPAHVEQHYVLEYEPNEFRWRVVASEIIRTQ